MQIVNVWVLWTYVSRIVTWGYDDLSSSKPTNQYRSSGSCPNCYANYAVDRNISTCMRTGDIGFTSGSNKTTWWYVDLGGLKSVGNIRIQFKDYGVEYIQRQMGRFSGFSLYVSNTTDRHSGYLCYKNGPDLGLPPLDFNTNCIVHGRYVIFYNERLPGTQYPIGFSTHGVITELCEVTVTGCSTGVYGESCDKHCPDNCMEHACDVINGTCLKCLPGWVGHFCDKGCSRHNIIENKCDMPCPDNCQEDRCNILNGTCEDCSPGFLGQYCNKTCKNGMYGINCKYRCSGHCLNNDTCNFITGFCNNGCSIGYVGDMCNENDLSANKITMQYKTYVSCPTCTGDKAVDRAIHTCTRMEEIGQTSTDNSTWWYVDLGGVYNVYNIRIQFKDYPYYSIRQRGRFAGFSLYVSNITDRHSGDLCYKDGPVLPPLDFHTNCITLGRYVIFYNERLIETKYPVGYETTNVFTELCEVIVTGCVRPDVYGSNCNKLCTDNCQEPRCNISNGACFNCGPGWIGDFCQKACPSGYYGLRCMTKCGGHCKDNEPCNHINGTCNNGCLDGWMGVKCYKQCLPGKYGPGCLYSCTGYCLNDKACNVTTGRCDAGCQPGYTGEWCDTECSARTYGQGCLNNCSGHCRNDATCNRTTGNCDQGCQAGYLGNLCKKECLLGTYGQGCLNTCSGHCLNSATCNRTTGSCDQGCQAGYKGKLCEEASAHTNEVNDYCNASFYIAGLSFLIFIIIVLVLVLLLFIRKYFTLVKEMRTLSYAKITRTSQQPGADNEEHHYQELRIA